MLASVPSAVLYGAQGHPVAVEVHVSTGLPGFTIVGLPDQACREARDRVRAALLSSGQPWPNKRVTVNLAPSGLRKVGAGLDLAIALALLSVEGRLPDVDVSRIGAVAELGLDGSLRPVTGTVPLVHALGDRPVVVAQAAAHEAALVAPVGVRSAATLAEVVAALTGAEPWPDAPPRPRPPAPSGPPDLLDVRGQPLAKLALAVCAAGGHHLLMVGSPGSGKTMLANRLVGLMPDLDPTEAIETTMVHSACGIALPPDGLVRRPPLRAPHHSASMVALVGGGTAAMRPGEVSAAHGGVLFCDELTEFSPSVLDALRQPLEQGVVRVTRARGSVDFPARFVFVGAMNPCPCGEGATPAACTCSPAAVTRYARRVSGPLLDRFDVRLVVERPSIDALLAPAAGEPSAVVAERVAAARALAQSRGVRCNADIPGHLLDDLAPVDSLAAVCLERALRAGRLTARGLHRVRRVGRTLADLEERAGPLTAADVQLALALRARPFAIAEAERHAG